MQVWDALIFFGRPEEGLLEGELFNALIIGEILGIDSIANDKELNILKQAIARIIGFMLISDDLVKGDL